MFCLALANSRLEPNSPEAVGRGTRIHVHCTRRLLRASMHRVGDSLRPVTVRGVGTCVGYVNVENYEAGITHILNISES